MPALTADTTPVSEPTVATPRALLLQLPLGVALLSVLVKLGHALAVPVMIAGVGLTVTIVIAKQPVGCI